LIPEVLEIELFVRLDKREIPVLYEIQTALGLLTPSDMDGKGTFVARFGNLSRESFELMIASLNYNDRPINGTPMQVKVPPGGHAAIDLGTTTINRYSTELPLIIKFSTRSRAREAKLAAKRLPLDDARSREKDDPSFPWHDRR